MDRRANVTSDQPTGHSSIELVVFDLGGVLVRVVDNWAEACARAGVAAGVAAVSDGIGERLMSINRRAETGELDADEFVRQCAATTGLDIDAVGRILTAWVPGPYPGAGDLLCRLATRNVRTACLSNTNAYHWRLLTASGGFGDLDPTRLTYRFASHLIGRAKPDPSTYEHVEQASAAPPQAILYFDDVESNCRAAADRGWQAVRIVAGGDPIAQIRARLDEHGLV